MAQSLSQPVYEVSIKFKPNDPALFQIITNVLANLGIPPTSLVEVRHGFWGGICLYLKERAQAIKIRRRFKTLGLKKAEVACTTLKKADWYAKWKEDFRPLMITQDLQIIPAWMKATYRPRTKTFVYIDTGLAFGTGLHATTQSMAQMISYCRSSIRSFFDVGTGTGILSLIACRYGAEDVVGIDIDAAAVKTARKNFQVNDLPVPKIRRSDIRSIRPSKKYDFVAANLISGELIDTAKRLVACVKPGKYLAVSGIALYNYAKVRMVFKPLPVTCRRVIKKDGWACILYKKNESS